MSTSAASSPDLPSITSLRPSTGHPLGRPHNKSTLWDEFLEHYSPTSKYFNTKHKKAYCRRCISRAGQELSQTAAARAEFESASFADGWEEWVYRRSFDKVEPISGRSSNMQRHVKTCSNISPDERIRIMANFEAAQTGAPPTRPTHESEERFRATMAAAVQRRFIEPAREERGLNGRFTAVNVGPPPINASRMPETSQSSLQAPRGPLEMTISTTTKSSPRLSLKNILNSETSTPPIPEQRPQYQAPASRPSMRPADPELLARLDNAMSELTQVRTHLAPAYDPRASYSPPGQTPPVTDAGILISCLRAEVSVLRRENEWLRVRYTAEKDQNAALQSKLGNYRSRFRDLAMDIDEDSETDEIMSVDIKGQRSNSAPALFSPISDSEGAKRRKLAHDDNFIRKSTN